MIKLETNEQGLAQINYDVESLGQAVQEVSMLMDYIVTDFTLGSLEDVSSMSEQELQQEIETNRNFLLLEIIRSSYSISQQDLQAIKEQYK